MYDFVHDALVVLVEGVDEVGEEVVVGGQVLAGEFDGLEVQDLRETGSTLHWEMV